MVSTLFSLLIFEKISKASLVLAARLVLSVLNLEFNDLLSIKTKFCNLKRSEK